MAGITAFPLTVETQTILQSAVPAGATCTIWFLKDTVSAHSITGELFCGGARRGVGSDVSNRPEAQASLAGYPDSANRGYNSLEECNEAWQALCVLGIHPHPVDPAFLRPPSPSASTFVNTSPRKSRADIASVVKRDGTAASGSTTKREATRTRSPEANAQLLADL
jgi:hypothetical protein